MEKNTNCYDKKIFNLSGDVFLDGYWQTEKYFCNISDIIRKDFSFKESFLCAKREVLDDIKNTNSVFVHFRRGDYVSDQRTNKFHGVCDMEYYKKSIEYFLRLGNNFKFFIFSDDIDWVKENFKIDNCFFVSNKKLRDFEELFLMSKCKHAIIANSSFSWWGAWLNDGKDKIVIAPKKWNNSDCYNEIVPDRWIKM